MVDIKKLLKKSIEEKLEDIKEFKPVACQNLIYKNNNAFCAASNKLEKGVAKCIYKKEKQINPMTGKDDSYYCNSCYQLKQQDLELIYLSRKNHPLFNLRVDKNRKIEEFNE
jgi:hypothetical protein